MLVATAELNSELSLSVARKDLQVDAQYVRLRHTLASTVQKEPTMAKVTSGYLLVVKTLERIGDHIVNLAEENVYNRDGKIVELNLGKTNPELVQQALDKDEKNSK
ncbi:PhoU domain-containing protein [Secundilactobacillus collinoides]|nr:PhoU domain-containing protein [Secundilactobacillus collinoides]